MSARRATLICAAAGAVSALGHAPVSMPAVSMAGLAAGILCVSNSRDARRAAWRGWAFSAAYFLVALHWIVEPFLVDIARHGWMAPFALVLLSGGLALFWALAAWIAVLVFPTPGWRRLAGLTILIFLGEVARSFVFTGFPWALHGYIWINSPIASLASIFGVHGLTLATLLASALTASVIAPGVVSRRRLIFSGALCGLVAGAWFSGLALSRVPVQTDRTDPLIVRLVQPNAAQHLKWRADQIPVFWERKLALTALPAERPLDLVVWPEVTLPYLLRSRPETTSEVVSAANGTPVLIGAQRYEGQELRNAVAILRPDGRIGPVYDKQHLVPFGEYFPGGRLAARLGLNGLATSVLGGFTPGRDERILDLRDLGLGRALALICYEAIFPRHAMSRGPRPDWIVQSTNDAWFGNFAGPQQHLDHARMRAIEQGLPLVRAANTGISALVDPHGRVAAQLPLNVEGIIDVALPRPLPATVFSKSGSVPVFLFAGLVLVGLRFWKVRNRN